MELFAAAQVADETVQAVGPQVLAIQDALYRLCTSNPNFNTKTGEGWFYCHRATIPLPGAVLKTCSLMNWSHSRYRGGLASEGREGNRICSFSAKEQYKDRK